MHKLYALPMPRLAKPPRSNRRALSTSVLYALAWTAVIAVAGSNAAIDVSDRKALGLMGCFWIAAWTLRLAHWTYRRRPSATHSNASVPPGVWLWSIEPIVCLLTVFAAQAGLFQMARLQLSTAALTHYATSVRDARSMTASSHAPKQLGLYTVTRTELLPDQTVLLRTSAEDAQRDAGFAHVLQTEAPLNTELRYRHVAGAWWSWKQR
jgi:hypothetical protein